jgi:iron complex transport system substrate-binding protein
MKRIVILFTIFSFLFITAASCQPQYQKDTFIDDAGRSVTFSSAPQRIISHVPAITETLFAIGLADRVVGVSDYDNYPPEAKQKTSVGNYYNPSLENIVALEPDLVLTDGYSTDLLTQLDGLHINYIVLNPQNYEGITKDIELVGKVTDLEEQATELIGSMDVQLNEVLNKVKGLPTVSVFYAVDMTDPNNPWTAGPKSMIDWLITTAGGTNIASNASGDYIQYSIEQIASADPEVIIYPAVHGTEFITADTFTGQPVWSKTSAVSQGKVYSIDADIVSRNGPRITQGLLEMAKLIHPEAFK